MFVCIAFVLGLLPPCQGAGYNSDNYRRAKPFMDGMLNMMDRMGLIDIDDYPERTGSGHDRDSSWYPQAYDRFRAAPYPPGAVSRMPGQLIPLQPRASGSPLEGVWQGRAGEILMIREGRFRIYVNRDQYRQGKLRYKSKTLYMHDPRTSITKKYDYATHKGRLVLRDAEGRLLLYRRLRQ